VRFIKISSTPSPVILEIFGETVGRTPYMLPVTTYLDEIPPSGVELLENEHLIKWHQIKAIPTVNGGLVKTENILRLKKEHVIYTDLVPYRTPSQIDVNIRHVR
jgi:hypothetical protein